MKDNAIDLIREIAAEHGVALDRSDPVLILQTATRIILKDALQQAEQSMAEAMARHRSELESASSKWQADSRRAAAQHLSEVQTTIATRASVEIEQAVRLGAAQLTQALKAHEKALATSNLVCALLGIIMVLGSAIAVLSSFE